MTRRKALTIALTMAALSGLIFALLLLSKPIPAVSHASYTWKPGCHCGAPKTTTTTAKKVTTTTAKKVTTTTVKATTTTVKATTTTVKATTTSKAATPATTPPSTAKASKTTSAKASTTTTAAKKKSTTTEADSTTSTSATDDQQTELLAVGAALSGYPGGGDGTGGDGSGGDGLTGGGPAAGQSSGRPHYYLSPVAIAFLLVYGISFALYRTRRMKVTTHRKIWNLLLLGTFMLCGIMGLLLAVGITRPTPWELPTWLLVWHVETGIAMSFISFFHIGWHLRYYLALVTGKRRAGVPQRVAVPPVAVGAPEPRRREATARSPRSALRTVEERAAAFERRQAARVAQATAAQEATTPTEADRWLDEARRRWIPAS